MSGADDAAKLPREMSDGLASATVPARPRRRGPSSTRSLDAIGDLALQGLCVLAALLSLAVLAAILYEVVNGAMLSIGHFGLSFLARSQWQPNFKHYGAAVTLFGTAVTSVATLMLAIPIGVSIALFLATVAPGRVRSVIGPLVEMLAAIPSVILGFWGIIVLGPFLHSTLGFLPIFGPAETTGAGLFNATLLLTIMVVPIVAAIARDLFLTVPQELTDGARALGATRWEVVRGVVLPTTASGVVSASFLGLGRALGEAIAVAQVCGEGHKIVASLFSTGATLGSRVATQYYDATTKLDVSSIFYLATILLAIGLVANLSAQAIVRRFDASKAAA